MRRLFVAGLILTVLSSVSARADEADPGKPTAADRKAVATCLAEAQKEEDGAGAFACIGTVSGPCLDEPDNYTTAMMLACHNREAAIWDERLNKDYKALVEGLGGEALGKLKTGQKAWLTVRDTTCDVKGSFWEGGTGASVLIADCLATETALRDLSLAGLRAYLVE